MTTLLVLDRSDLICKTAIRLFACHFDRVNVATTLYETEAVLEGAQATHILYEHTSDSADTPFSRVIQRYFDMCDEKPCIIAWNDYGCRQLPKMVTKSISKCDSPDEWIAALKGETHGNQNHSINWEQN